MIINTEKENGLVILGGPGTRKTKTIVEQLGQLEKFEKDGVIVIDTGNHKEHYSGYSYFGKANIKNLDIILTELLKNKQSNRVVVVEGLDKLIKENSEFANRLGQLVYIGEIILIATAMEITTELVDIISMVSNTLIMSSRMENLELIEKIVEIPKEKAYFRRGFRDIELVNFEDIIRIERYTKGPY